VVFQSIFKCKVVCVSSPCPETLAIARARAGTRANCFTRAKNRTCQWCYTIPYRTCRKHFFDI